MNVKEAIHQMENAMLEEEIIPAKGLGEELFLFSSTLLPIVNVDLLILDGRNRFLLSWRDDNIEGQGWHVPGRCIRFHESIGESIRKCAETELGLQVSYYPEPLGVYEGIRTKIIPALPNQDYRSHFISLLFFCHIDKKETEFLTEINDENSKLKWFDKMPCDLVDGQQRYYREWNIILKKTTEIKKRNRTGWIVP